MNQDDRLDLQAMLEAYHRGDDPLAMLGIKDALLESDRELTLDGWYALLGRLNATLINTQNYHGPLECARAIVAGTLRGLELKYDALKFRLGQHQMDGAGTTRQAVEVRWGAFTLGWLFVPGQHKRLSRHAALKLLGLTF